MDNRRQKISNTIKLLGITERESDIFFLLLEHGAMSAADLAKHIQNIPRTSIYDVLKTLQIHGLVSSFVRDERTSYQVENIEHIVDILESQRREIADKQNAIRSIANIFHQYKSGTAYEPGTRFFKGKNGIFAIHRELQNTRAETRTIVDIKSVSKIFPSIIYEDNLKDFQKFQILKKDLMIKSKEAQQYLKAAPLNQFHKVKWLPPLVNFKTDTLIWEGHVAIIDYTDQLSGIIIDNPTISETFVAWFEMMWESIK